MSEVHQNPAEDVGRLKRRWAVEVLLLGLVAALLVPFVIPTAGRIAAGLRYPYQLDSEEGFVLWQAWQLRHGHNIFRPLDSPPYVAATYGPLFPLLNAAFLWGNPTFLGGRLIVALSVAAICLFMALIVWSETRQFLAAILGPLLFLNSYDVYQWLPFYRVDFPALVLGMAGLWLLARPAPASEWRWRTISLLFVAMVYTRQVELAPLVAALIYLAQDRSQKGMILGVCKRLARYLDASPFLVRVVAVFSMLVSGLIFFGVCKGVALYIYPDESPLLARVIVDFTMFFTGFMPVILIYFVAAMLMKPESRRLLRNVGGWGLAIAAVLTALTRGQFLVHNIYYNANPFSLWQIKTVLIGRYLEDGRFIGGHFYNFNRFFAAAFVLCVIWYLFERRKLEAAPSAPTEHTGLFALYAIIASFGILGLGKIGAAMNYLIEPKAAWALFIALILGKAIGPRPVMIGEAPSVPLRRAFHQPLPFFLIACVLVLHALEFVGSLTLLPAIRYWLRHNPTGRIAEIVRKPGVNRYITSRPPVLHARDTANPSATDTINGDRVVELLRPAPEPVFCELPIFAMDAGKSVYIQPFIMKELSAEGKWDQTPVVDALRNKQFSIIVTTEDIGKEGFFFHYTREMVEAIRSAYQLRETLDRGPAGPPIFTYYIYEPR